MSLSPNAGKDLYLFEKQTGVVHHLKNETEDCAILKTGIINSAIADSFERASDVCLFKYGKLATKCKYCFEEE